MKCNHCQTKFDGSFCPSCGERAATEMPPKPQKQRKPLYKKWWLYAVAAVAVILVIAATVGANKGERLDWAKIKLSSMLPVPEAKRAEILTNSDDELLLYVLKTTEEQFNAYVSACKDKAYTVEAKTDNHTYAAFNADGYSLDVSFSENKMRLQLEAPMEMTDIVWPVGAAGKQLPAPKSSVGKFSYESDDDFFVYIGNTTKADFAQYAAACAEKGFTVDYRKGDDYYYADNAMGWHLSLNYVGNNVMSIDMDAPDRKTVTTTSAVTAATTAKPTTEPKGGDSVSTDFKAAMDSYEKFMDEYIAFMKKYNENPSDIGLLSDYAAYMKKYAEMLDKFEAWETEDMGAAEAAYYVEVQTRVNKKLLEISQ